MTCSSIRRSSLLAAVALLAGACASNAVPNGPDSAGASPGNNAGAAPPAASAQASDWAAIEKIEAEAKAIAKVNGCTASSECRAAAVGSRACGGPRYYIPYCATATDSTALFTKLSEVSAAERAYNTKYQLASTCEMRLPPAVGITGGVCAAQ